MLTYGTCAATPALRYVGTTCHANFASKSPSAVGDRFVNPTCCSLWMLFRFKLLGDKEPPLASAAAVPPYTGMGGWVGGWVVG
jgi:hypothetical protein